MSEVPHRAVRLKLDLEADDRMSMIQALENIGRRIAMQELTNGCSGGPDSGYIYTYTESEHPTAKEYREQLTDWLASTKPRDSQGGDHGG